MKLIFALIIAVGLVLASSIHAQPTSGSPDPQVAAEMTGTIKEYTPGSTLVLETLAPTEPVQFKLSKNDYMKVGGDNVADKVTLIGN